MLEWSINQWKGTCRNTDDCHWPASCDIDGSTATERGLTRVQAKGTCVGPALGSQQWSHIISRRSPDEPYVVIDDDDNTMHWSQDYESGNRLIENPTNLRFSPNGNKTKFIMATNAWKPSSDRNKPRMYFRKAIDPAELNSVELQDNKYIQSLSYKNAIDPVAGERVKQQNIIHTTYNKTGGILEKNDANNQWSKVKLPEREWGASDYFGAASAVPTTYYNTPPV